MARPLPLTSGTFNYPLQPASRELCDTLGVLMVTASPERMVTLNRLYDRMTPAAKARVNTKLHLTEASEAFDTALATGRLTEIMGQPNYVGDYMYMGTHPKTGRAAFKHRDTREYLK